MFGILLAGVASLIAVIVVVGVSVRSELEAALPLAISIQQSLVTGDEPQLEQDVEAFIDRSNAAADAVENPVWKLGERLPGIGPNLSAISTTARVARSVAEGAVGRATRIEVSAFRPVGGAIDVDAVLRSRPHVIAADATIHEAAKIMAQIDTRELIGPVSVPVIQLRRELERVGEMTTGLSVAAELLPDAMGLTGPRNYLLIFPNTAELRSQGGNVTAFATLSVENGVMSIMPRIDSAGAMPVFPESPLPLDPEIVALFGDHVGGSISTATMLPDFPTTAALMVKFAEQAYDMSLDGVVSIDPVALGYVLEAIGPVSLQDGSELTADNLVDVLLSEVYRRYPDGADQDAFYTGVGSLIALAVVSGQGSFFDLIGEFGRAAEERRLGVWFVDADAQDVVAGTPLERGFAADDDDATTVGVLFNDFTGTKLDYHMDATLDVSANRCEADHTEFAVSGTLTSSVPAEGLPPSLLSPILPPGEVLTRIDVLGPNGTAVAEVRLGDERFDNAEISELDGRPVVTVPITLRPGESRTFDVYFDGSRLDYATLEVELTPMVHETPLRVYDAHC